MMHLNECIFIPIIYLYQHTCIYRTPSRQYIKIVQCSSKQFQFRPISYIIIQLLDLSEPNITSNMAQQVILGEAVSRI